MIPDARVAVFGGEDLARSVRALGFEPADDGDVAVVDLRDDEAVRRAASLPPNVSRVIVAGEHHREFVAAIGIDPARVISDWDPSILGPIVAGLLPKPRRTPTRVVLVTGVRGGVGRTLLATNLAWRISRRRSVCLIDATGTGVAAWWLGASARPWSSFEGLTQEMSPDHLSVAAESAAEHLRVLGGASAPPSVPLLETTVRAATGLDDTVIVDAPLIFDPLTTAIRATADRSLVLCYDDPASQAALAAAAVGTGDWLIASQVRSARVGQQRAFSCLPRDEGAIAAAIDARREVTGPLGRAYDDLADLLVIDAT
ncbi:MAG TPA: hypothetical protein VJQ09_01635 [Candidatus Limnocylindria bacterium]|nr:hypothetical protein [Candidatus Limnocylindria bacterium]